MIAVSGGQKRHIGTSTGPPPGKSLILDRIRRGSTIFHP
jgi:hypothetical protein